MAYDSWDKMELIEDLLFDLRIMLSRAFHSRIAFESFAIEVIFWLK